MAISFGKNSYVMRDIMSTPNTDWLTSQFPGLRIEHLHWTDNLVFENTITKERRTLDRYTIEDAKDPRALMIQTARQVMGDKLDSGKEFGEFMKEIGENALRSIAINAVPNLPTDYSIAPPPQQGSVLVSDGTGGQSWIPSQGAGTVTTGVYYNKPVADISDTESAAIVQKQLLGKKLFTTDQARQLQLIKTALRKRFNDRPHEQMGWDMSNLVIAGGCFASWLNQEHENDIDVFLLDSPQNAYTSKALYDKCHGKISEYEHFVASQLNPFGNLLGPNTAIRAIPSHPAAPVHVPNPKVRIGNNNYMDNDKIEQTIFFEDSKFQYITTKFKTREELISHFDYKHCCVSYDYMTDMLYITREVYDLIKTKTLAMNTNKAPAQWRYEKFIKRGWKYRAA